MGPPWRGIAVAAVAGSALLAAADGVAGGRRQLGEAAGLLWLAQLAAWAIWTTFVYPRFVSPLRHLPEPRCGHWLLGHGRILVRELPGQVMRKWLAETEHDGLIRYRFFFNRERLVVASPKALAEVLVAKSYMFEKPEAVRDTLRRILGCGLLLAEGDEHRAQRRKLQPAFDFRHVKGLYPVFWRKAGEVVGAMAAACEAGGGEAVLEVNAWASRCTLDIIGVAGMGVDFGAIADEQSRLAQTYGRLARPSRQATMLLTLSMFLPGWMLNHLPLRRNQDIRAAAQDIRAVCRDLLRAKRQKLAGEAQPGAAADRDIVSVALASGLFSDDKLVDQLMTFLAAGHDTTASALTWAVYQLARFPEKQRRLRAEVRARLPSLAGGGEAVSSSDMDDMPYLQAVCSEVLRTFSPVPQTIREAACDTTIQGQPVRRGTRLVLAPWATNVDGALWGPDAGDFKPERWLAAGGGSGGGSGGGGAASNYAFMTFLHGPRSCIGAGFARGELACLLAAWTGRFEFALHDEALMDERNLQFKAAVTARPAHGMHMRTRVVAGW